MTREDGHTWETGSASVPGAGHHPSSGPEPAAPWAAPGGGPESGPTPGAAPYGPPGPAGQGRPVAPPLGVVALRPLALGDIFNGAFGYLRANPKTVMGWAIVVMGISSVIVAVGMGGYLTETGSMINQAFQNPTVDPDDPTSSDVGLWSVITMYAGQLVAYIGQSVLTGLLAAVVGSAVLGRRLSMRQAREAVRGRVGAVLMVAVLLFLIGLGWTALFIGLMVAAVLVASLGMAGTIAGIVIGIGGTVGTVVLAAWIYVRTALAMPVTVLERIGPGRSLARSWRLSRGSWWRMFGILVLSALIAYLVANVLTTPFMLAGFVPGAISTNEFWPPVVATALAYLGTVISGALTAAFLTGVTTLLYVDLRMRREALDLRLQTAAQSGESLDTAVYLPEPRPAPAHDPGTPGALA